MGTPYKMKKSPMKRNFGIGSPVKKATDPKKASFEQRTKDFWNQPAENRISSEEPKAKTTTPKAKTTTPKTKTPDFKSKGNFNFTGESKSTTPKYSTTKAATTTTSKKSKSLVGRTVDKIHKNEMKIGELKESRAQDIKKVKGNTVNISKKEVLKQMKKTNTKIPYGKIKDSLKKAITAGGKTARFIPGVGTAITIADMLTSKTATATKPVDHGASKKGSYTSNIQDIVPKSKKKSIWDNKKKIVKR